MKRTLEHAKKPSDICEHLQTLYRLVIEAKAKIVIECGVRGGESTVPLLEAAHVTDGHVYSVDVDPCNETRALVESYGFGSRWTFTQTDDLNYAAMWANGSADLIFIDTSHEAAHTEKEIAAFVPLLRPKGIMVFHDTVSFPEGVLGPIQRFTLANPTYAFQNHVNCNGLGILRKP